MNSLSSTRRSVIEDPAGRRIHRRAEAGVVHRRRWATRATTAGALLAGLLMSFAPAAQAFTVEKLFAGNCTVEHCGNKTGSAIEEPETALEAEPEAFRQAAGFVPYGVTDFRFKTEKLPEAFAFVPGVSEAPVGFLAHGSVHYLRTDVAPGVVTNPYGAPQCSDAAFTGVPIKAEEGEKPALFVYKGNEGPPCAVNTEIGVNKILTDIEPEESKPLKFHQWALEALVYNLEPYPGYSSTYGAAFATGKKFKPNEAQATALGLEEGKEYWIFTHTIIEGNVEWAGDYHDYFEIRHIPGGLIESRLVFFGAKEFGGTHKPIQFIRNPSACTIPGPQTTTSVKAESYAGESAGRSFATPVGTNECENESSFSEAISMLLTPQNTIPGQTDGLTTEAKSSHPSAESGKADSSDVKVASVTLPAGLTLNPSAAAGLEGCTKAEFGIGTRNENHCAATSKIGTVALEVPTLPAGSLSGNLYLGKPESGSITAPPYTMYVEANSARYGVDVRLEGAITPNAETGQLTTTISDNPQAPFTSVKMTFNSGPFAPLANPLTCGAATTTASFTPYSGSPATTSPSIAPFNISCSGSAPFAAPGLSQGTSVLPATGGSATSFALNLERGESEQYLSQMHTVLPKGLVGLIPSVSQCAEAAANAGTCSAESQIGTVTVKAGAGSSPYTFNGQVYLTEKYAGAPFGLSIVVPAEAGIFHLGNVVSRAQIKINPETAQVEVSAKLPQIVGGIPIRMRSMSFQITRQNFERTPTNCSALPLVNELTGTPSLPAIAGGTATLTSTLQASNCSSLPFKPQFTAETQAQTSRKNGAGLTVSIMSKSGEANIAKTVTTLPGLLPSRLATLEKACTETQGKSNILGCPASSRVGKATVSTPTLPGTLSGPAYIVSHGGAEFPDLDLVLEGDGVRILLVGNTAIHKGITTTTFAATPDVPFSSFKLETPEATNSLLSSNGSFCKKPLIMPTTLVGQNGATVKQNTKIMVNGCFPVIRHRASGHFAVIVVKAPAAGKITVRGNNLHDKTFKVKRDGMLTLRVPLSAAGVAALNAGHRFKVRAHLGFAPKARGNQAFSAITKISFG